MKLSALFAKYLYQNRQLRLPGIGTFTIDPSVVIPEVADKNTPEFTKEIKFVQQPIAAADEDFINFIRTETGKIKPLAESDLDSFLADAKILLNIGKPFYLEGIGSLQKNRDGELSFTPGTPVLSTSRPEPSFHEVVSEPGRPYHEDAPAATSSNKLLVALAVILGITVVIWLGYKLYNRNAPEGTLADTVVIAPHDTARAGAILDSVQKIINSASQAAAATAAPAGYRFVIEKTASKQRALRRFQQIKDNLTDIRMDANADSTFFSLYFILPVKASDTTRIKDSLRVWYGRKEVTIEY